MVGKNTRKSYRRGAANEQSQIQNPRTGLWTKRDTTIGQFSTVKKSGGDFKGIRKGR